MINLYPSKDFFGHRAGCGSLNEIARAEELGAEIIKIFLGSQLGCEFVNAIKGPCPWTSIIPIGGVSATEINLRGWFDAGVSCVGMGSNLIKKEFLISQDYRGLEINVRNTLALISRVRND